MPRGRRALPAACVARLRRAGLIIHAGDLITLEVLDELRGYGEVIAVHGNVDSAQVRAALPERAWADVDGVRLGVVHDGGPRTGRLARLRRAFPGVAAVIFGHSHIPLLERDPADGFQIFNPGSPTDKRRQPVATMGEALVDGETVSFEIIPLYE
jgi:putative phosphoesterase